MRHFLIPVDLENRMKTYNYHQKSHVRLFRREPPPDTTINQKTDKKVHNDDPNDQNTSPENHVFLDMDFDVILNPKLCPNGAQNDTQIQPYGTPGPPCGVQDDINMSKMPPQAILGPKMSRKCSNMTPN